MKKLELVFVPFPAIGHLVSIVEFARHLVDTDDRFSVALLVMKGPIFHPALTTYIRSVSASFSASIRFVHLPQLGPDQSPDSINPSPSPPSPPPPRSAFLHNIMERQRLLVRDAVHQLVRSQTARLAGIVVDSFCASMMDVGDEMGVPSYAFSTSSAASLALMFHLQTLHDHQGVDLTEFADSDTDELMVPGFSNSIPTRVLPALWVDKEGGGSEAVLKEARSLRQSKGILVNTFMELEHHHVNGPLIPPVYPVGPLLNLNHRDGDGAHQSDVIRWLDGQPPSSVVFLCFGSVGGFNQQSQVENIATALENSGYRFLWSLRRPPPKGIIADSTDYTDFKQILPDDFLDRTVKSGKGKIIGWAPQAAVLAHPAVGGFVSHCGWNSVLESIWYGVPVATWPMYAEQQLNAFQIVKELGLGVEIRLGDSKESNCVISAQEIESKIRSLMGEDDSINGVREKMACMTEMGRKALIQGGSSNSTLHRFIGDIIINLINK